MMKKIAIYCVTYHSYSELYHYLQSLNHASAQSEVCMVDIYIADNTCEDQEQIDTQCHPSLTIKVFPFYENLGYFGAIQKMMSKTNILLYDYVIISNVDVIISPDFFSKLANYPLSPNDGWIAPAIISQNDGCDLNPQATHRYSLTKLKILHFFYQHPTVNWLYEHTLHLSKRHQHHQPGQVYAGHGSFIVLTHEYFVRCGIIDYPIFLYGEEIYIGEQCLRNKLKVNYFPSLQVNDIGNVSTGKMKRSFYYKCNADAIKYIIDNYYKE